MSRRIDWHAAALAFVLGGPSVGCAFGDGEAYGVVSGKLDARYEMRAERDQGDGWQRLASEYAVKLSRFELVVDAVEIVDSPEGAPPPFDPSHPPAGYGLCHNGHCHRDDGVLVSYAEIASDLAGGAPASRTVLAFALGEVDVLGGDLRSLDCAVSCVLSTGHLTMARLLVARLRMIGTVRDALGRLAGESPFAGDLPLGAATAEAAPSFGLLTSALDVTLDDDRASLIMLTLRLPLGSELFDDVGFDALGADAERRLDLNDVGASSAIEGRFAEAVLSADVVREDP